MRLMKKIMAKVDSLPVFPSVVSQVLEITSDPGFSMNHLVKTVSMDPGITANVLRQCNSAFFGLRHKASSLNQAVPLIGATALVEVVLGSGVGSFFRKAGGNQVVSGPRLWRHSMATALAANRLAKVLRAPNPTTVYTAALLHDIAKFVMGEFMADKMKEIEFLVVKEGYPYAMAEKRVMEVDHATLGAFIAKKWKLGKPIQEAVAFHHIPKKAKLPRTTTNLVSLANYLVIQLGEGTGFGDDLMGRPDTALLELGITPVQLDALKDDLADLLERAESLLNL